MADECVFCRIAAGLAPCHRIWEDDRHLAFLSIYPNTPGFSVVITKAHHSSHVCGLDGEVFLDLMGAAKKVALLLEASLEGVGRTGLIAEGYGIDHAHVKLFPMYGAPRQWKPVRSKIDKFFNCYEGYISSHDGARASDMELQVMAERIRTRWRQG